MQSCSLFFGQDWVSTKCGRAGCGSAQAATLPTKTMPPFHWSHFRWRSSQCDVGLQLQRGQAALSNRQSWFCELHHGYILQPKQGKPKYHLYLSLLPFVAVHVFAPEENCHRSKSKDDPLVAGADNWPMLHGYAEVGQLHPNWGKGCRLQTERNPTNPQEWYPNEVCSQLRLSRSWLHQKAAGAGPQLAAVPAKAADVWSFPQLVA